jgi:integrase
MKNQLATLDATRESILASIERADLADSTKAQYQKAIRNYLDEGHRLTDAQALATYAAELPKSSRAFLKAAVGRWAEHISNEIKGMATPDNVDQVQASLYRFEALQEAIRVKGAQGTKAHTWLSPAEVKRLMSLPDQDVYGERDRVALGLLVAAGLRRAEAVKVRFADLKLQPVKGKMRTVIAVKGKGAKDRIVPISDKLANLIDEWGKEVGHEGYVLRSLGRNREPGESLSAVGLFNIVAKYGRELGKDDLAPHDLRRTYAQIGYESGVPITQISTLLGHASVATTQRYLNLDLDLEATVSDFVPL